MQELILAKSSNGFFFFSYLKESNQIRIEVPEERLYSNDFEKGLAHELTEITLRKIILPMLKRRRFDRFFVRCLLHEATILSIGRYKLVAEQYDILEEDYEKANERRG